MSSKTRRAAGVRVRGRQGRISGLKGLILSARTEAVSIQNPPHPGALLRERLEGTTLTDAAKSLGITRAMLSQILNEASSISAEMDLRLSMALGTSPGFWLGLQSDFHLRKARKRFMARVRRIVKPNPSDLAAVVAK